MKHKNKDILTEKYGIPREVDIPVTKSHNNKEFKDGIHKKTNKMAHSYKTYAQAVRKRRRDEITVFDRVARIFRNKKVRRKRARKVAI